jgi:hypothetical protein
VQGNDENLSYFLKAETTEFTEYTERKSSEKSASLKETKKTYELPPRIKQSLVESFFSKTSLALFKYSLFVSRMRFE